MTIRPSLHQDGANAPATLDRPSLRTALRQGSDGRHERLDGRFEGMLAADTLRPYALFVIVNEACHRVLEPILDASPLADVMPELKARHRTQLLRDDLDAMGAEPANEPTFSLGSPTLPEAFGIAYVLEGSRLGARFLLKAAAKATAAGALDGASFRYLQSADEPDYFRSFMMCAETLVATDEDRRLAVAAANATFDLFLSTEAKVANETMPGDSRA